jgi:hypothetical protein
MFEIQFVILKKQLGLSGSVIVVGYTSSARAT